MCKSEHGIIKPKVLILNGSDKQIYNTIQKRFWINWDIVILICCSAASFAVFRLTFVKAPVVIYCPGCAWLRPSALITGLHCRWCCLATSSAQIHAWVKTYSGRDAYPLTAAGYGGTMAGLSFWRHLSFTSFEKSFQWRHQMGFPSLSFGTCCWERTINGVLEVSRGRNHGFLGCHSLLELVENFNSKDERKRVSHRACQNL